MSDSVVFSEEEPSQGPEKPVGDNPSLAMACNAYRRIYGTWPNKVRFHPGHFHSYVSELDQEQLTLLASVFEVTVTDTERSPRLTVMGPDGALTYDEGVTEADWDAQPFDDWLRTEAAERRLTF